MTGPRRFPLVRHGEGWAEVEPEPGAYYEAYREMCDDQDCPSAWPGAEHAHIRVAAEDDAGSIE